MIIRTKKRKDNISQFFNGDKLCVFVKFDECKNKLPEDLRKVGTSFVPSPRNGKWCNKNANGYETIDKISPKVLRTINSFYIYPYGNKDADPVLIDVDRLCYKRIFHEGLNIEIVIEEDENGELFIKADLPENYTEEQFITSINIFNEIFGYCYVDRTLRLVPIKVKIKHNWEFLPKETRPSEIAKRNVLVEGNKIKGRFYKERLEIIETYPYINAHEGLMGYLGYFAYVFENICVFDTDIYGNATYIVKKDNWEEISKLTKRELLEKGLVLEKIIHSKNWEQNFQDAFVKYEK